MKTIYYGHACLLVEVAGLRILFDPFVSPNPKAEAIDVSSIEADFVLLTHGHEDHVADAGEILERTGATLVANFEVATWFGGRGAKNAVPLNTGGGCDLPFGRVTFVNAVHSSSLPDGSYGGVPGGFVVETSEGTFYHSGDTALTFDMKLLAERWDLSWAALCIGDQFTMGVTDAVKAAGFVGADRILGIHYDTFPPIEIDHDAAKATFEEAGRELFLPAIGETLDL